MSSFFFAETSEWRSKFCDEMKSVLVPKNENGFIEILWNVDMDKFKVVASELSFAAIEKALGISADIYSIQSS